MPTQSHSSRSAKRPGKGKRLSKSSAQATASKQTPLKNRVKELEKAVRDLSRERDLYRREWLRAKDEAAAVWMTDEECDEIVKQGITLDKVITEIEQMQNGAA